MENKEIKEDKFYAVFSISQLEEFIAYAKEHSTSLNNLKSGASTILLEFQTAKKHGCPDQINLTDESRIKIIKSREEKEEHLMDVIFLLFLIRKDLKLLSFY